MTSPHIIQNAPRNVIASEGDPFALITEHVNALISVVRPALHAGTLVNEIEAKSVIDGRRVRVIGHYNDEKRTVAVTAMLMLSEGPIVATFTGVDVQGQCDRAAMFIWSEITRKGN